MKKKLWIILFVSVFTFSGFAMELTENSAEKTPNNRTQILKERETKIASLIRITEILNKLQTGKLESEEEGELDRLFEMLEADMPEPEEKFSNLSRVFRIAIDLGVFGGDSNTCILE